MPASLLGAGVVQAQMPLAGIAVRLLSEKLQWNDLEAMLEIKGSLQAVRRTLAAEKMVSDNLFRGRLPSPKPAAKAAASTWKRLWLLVQQTLQSFWHWLSDKQHAH